MVGSHVMTQLQFPSGPPSTDTVAILNLINGDPLHAANRAAVVDAIADVAHTEDGAVDPNLVRERIPEWVYPRCIGPVYSALTKLGHLEVDGWVMSTDASGRNVGKPTRRYRWTGRGA